MTKNAVVVGDVAQTLKQIKISLRQQKKTEQRMWRHENMSGERAANRLVIRPTSITNVTETLFNREAIAE
jgi:hypothetical protein